MTERTFIQTFEKVYHERPYHDRTKIVLRMVRWNSQRPYIEKREYFKSEDGENWKPGKSKGLTFDDWNFLLDRKGELEEDFKKAAMVAFSPSSPLKEPRAG